MRNVRSNEHISHTSNELSAARSAGLAAGYGVNVTTSHAGAVSDAAEDAEGAGNTDTTQAGFSRIGGAKSGSQEPELAWQEPNAEGGNDGAGESVTAKELRDATRREDVSIVPIAVPLPVMVQLQRNIGYRAGAAPELKMIVILAILVTFALSYITFRFANRINKIMGVTGSSVITMVMGLLLGAIAVNFVSIGVWNIYTSMV